MPSGSQSKKENDEPIPIGPKTDRPTGAVTRILRRVEARDPGAVDALVAAVRSDLRRAAAYQLNKSGTPATIQPTELVHEAFLKLFANGTATWESSRHFFLCAGRAMQGSLVDRARRATALKRGGGCKPTELNNNHPADMPETRVAELGDALTILEATFPSRADLVRLRFFVGLTEAEAANVLGISVSTAKREWKAIKAWLSTRIRMSESSA